MKSFEGFTVYSPSDYTPRMSVGDKVMNVVGLFTLIGIPFVCGMWAGAELVGSIIQ